RAAETINENEKKMRQLQEAELAAQSNKAVSQSHEKITSDLEDLFNAVMKWSRLYFRAPKTWPGCSYEGLQGVAPEFLKLLTDCCRSARLIINGPQCPKIQFLVEAAVNQFLVKHIFTDPFGFCEPE